MRKLRRPNPPPPGVSIVSTSPGWTSRANLPPTSSACSEPARWRVLRPSARMSTLETEGSETARGVRRASKRRAAAETRSADHAVATAVRPRRPNRGGYKIVNPHRITAFEDFGIGQPRVGHVRMDGVGSGGIGGPRCRRRSFRNSRRMRRRRSGCSSSPGWRRPLPGRPTACRPRVATFPRCRRRRQASG